jgi:hypothetical protein
MRTENEYELPTEKKSSKGRPEGLRAMGRCGLKLTGLRSGLFEPEM